MVSDEADLPPVDEIGVAAMSGWVLPVTDPDTAVDVDTLWDQLVPKDADISAPFDLDIATADAAPFMEWGEVNQDRILDMSNLDDDNNWYRWRKMYSFANNPLGFIAGTPDTFYATIVQKIRSRKRIMADHFSFSLLAFTLAVMSNVDSNRTTPPSEARWMQWKYIDLVLEQAWMDMVGLTETGAETPWIDATAAVEELVEPPIVDSGTRVGRTDMLVSAWTTFDITVPGRREVKILSGASA